ncbi:cobalt-precorrin 6A reductase [Desulfitobacterium dichloroeliminans LMG P-21439]|uniref:Cobalt-precorrin 6A reductase n=1 Tax=Desulfitobacterium dichloroeliminans (strain LMG P-21439 / DCA1) TaxID=871963 RepID=L0F7D0_DESDL|nr:precorrin-6A reductase [Desulfitobacterium dichloroeliminans]AGA68541.1 cobalt-precorrin 6A reductase [Desulfitobacterium dichloroeliminans LMG P-21439]
MNLFILAGTEDGRELASAFQKRGYQVLVSTLTEYGSEIAQEQGLTVRFGALDEDSLRRILREQEMSALIDATHPYAQEIHGLAQRIASECGRPYFRWERPLGEYPPHQLIYFVSSLEEAAERAAQLGGRIFLSTGSKNLSEWLAQPVFQGCEVFVRILPTAQVLSQCETAGLKPYQIIAMQGPFTSKFNEALWEQMEIEVVISKESGSFGGTGEKVQACLQLGIPIILLERPASAQAELNTDVNDPHAMPTTIGDFVRKVEDTIGL